jgi:hypothetical protein
MAGRSVAKSRRGAALVEETGGSQKTTNGDLGFQVGGGRKRTRRTNRTIQGVENTKAELRRLAAMPEVAGERPERRAEPRQGFAAGRVIGGVEKKRRWRVDGGNQAEQRRRTATLKGADDGRIKPTATSGFQSRGHARRATIDKSNWG